ncbi:MAG: hypothetical protein ACE5H9_05540 [Anaerolineae bacterium]
MELRQYWLIIRKRIWIPVLLLGVVGGLSLALQFLRPDKPVYSTSMRFTVGVRPQEIEGEFNYDSYYAWLSSEYLADDFSAIVSSQAFAQDVNTHLAEMGSSLSVPSGVISGVTIAEKEHRILRVNVTWDDPGELADLSQAIITAIEQDGPRYFSPLGTPGALIKIIDQPSPPAPNPPSLTQRLDLPVRLLLALAAGIALVFLLDYLDTSVRNREEVETLGIPVLAEIPRK